MRRFDYYTAKPGRLAELLELVCDDALAAEGCSIELRLPPGETPSWDAWLSEEVTPEDEIPEEFEEMRRTVDVAAFERDFK